MDNTLVQKNLGNEFFPRLSTKCPYYINKYYINIILTIALVYIKLLICIPCIPLFSYVMTILKKILKKESSFYKYVYYPAPAVRLSAFYLL